MGASPQYLLCEALPHVPPLPARHWCDVINVVYGVSCLLIGCITTEVLAATLTANPSRSQFFEGESVTLTCEDENISDGWAVKRITTRRSEKQCGNEWGEPAGSTCSITLRPDDSGVYWCESTSGSSSRNSIQLSVSGGSVILQSPVLPVMEGDDVTLSCRAKSPAHNLPADFYKDGSVIGHGPSGDFPLKSVKISDDGLYKCSISGQGESPSSRISVEGKDPIIPPPSPSSSSSFSGRMSLSGNSANQGPLTVSPSRSQFFEFESVTLTCEDERTVWSNTTRGTKKQCGDAWGTADGSTCKITLLSFDSGVYWCESTDGSISSSSIQLSVSGGSVILQSPVLPVMEGDDVTLSCRAKSPAHNLRAAFYKDGSFIGDGDAGNFVLTKVKSSSEGMYKCSISDLGESPSSKISVSAPSSSVSN